MSAAAAEMGVLIERNPPPSLPYGEEGPPTREQIDLSYAIGAARRARGIQYDQMDARLPLSDRESNAHDTATIRTESVEWTGLAPGDQVGAHPRRLRSWLERDTQDPKGLIFYRWGEVGEDGKLSSDYLLGLTKTGEMHIGEGGEELRPSRHMQYIGALAQGINEIPAVQPKAIAQTVAATERDSSLPFRLRLHALGTKALDRALLPRDQSTKNEKGGIPVQRVGRIILPSVLGRLAHR